MQSTHKDEHTGSCLCEKVSFKACGELRDVIACHCRQCQKQTGLYYAATNVKTANLEIVGEENISWYAASDTAKRGFCSTCGTALFWKANGQDRISILAGAFDQPSSLKMTAHIFCADKGDYYELTDDLPKFDQGNL